MALSLMSYQTSRAVLVHSPCISCTGWLLRGITILHIVCYVFIYNRGYMTDDFVTGVTSYQLDANANHTDVDPVCGEPYPCASYPAAAFSRSAGDAIFATTKIYTSQLSPSTYYVSHAADTDITITNFIVAVPGLSRGTSDADIDVRFSGYNLTEDFPPGTSTTLNVGELLGYAGLSIDGPSSAGGSGNASVRDSGCILLGLISFTNMMPTGFYISPFIPIYGTGSVYVVKYSNEQTTYRMSSTASPTLTMIPTTQTGVQISFSITGRYGRIDATLAFVNLITSMALLEVANQVVDKIFFTLSDPLHRLKYRDGSIHFLGFRKGFGAIELKSSLDHPCP
jgi:hypothetical protein